ncbi:MAG: hypothetical protein ACRDHG_00610, partial [Anaerolineales bacterium]
MKKRLYSLAGALSAWLLLSLLLGACQPAEQPPAVEEVATAVVEEEEVAEPAPTAEVVEEKPMIVVAYDSDIDHIELMQF